MSLQNCSQGCRCNPCPYCQYPLSPAEVLRQRQLAYLQKAKEKDLYLERLRRLADEKSILTELSERSLWP